MRSKTAVRGFVVFTLLTGSLVMTGVQAEERPRARDIGLVVGTFPPGPLNAITDVVGVRVGHATLISGDDIRTGVTAIIPAPGNLYTHPVPAWIHVGNGYGKLIGETQVREFGEIETPILLVCTLCVWSAANALKEWNYLQPGMGEHTVNPIVGETNDSTVNNMWADPIQRVRNHLFVAIAPVLVVPALRRRLATDHILAIFRRILPDMTQTEKDAIDAGTVWWDADLFSGKPDWNKMLAIPQPKLTAEEQAFVDGPCEEVCAMTDDWEVTHERYDLPPQVWQFLKDKGFLGMIIPKKYGGLGFSAIAHSAVVMKLSTRSNASIHAPPFRR